MSRALTQVWKVVVAAKARAKERLEADLAEARRHHGALLGALEEAKALEGQAQAKQLAHEEKIARMLADPRGLAPTAYLDYDLYRAPLAQAIDEARAGVRRASDATDEQAREVARLGVSVRRADAALDAAREQLKKTIAAAQRRADERNDDEAGETAAGRMRRGGNHA